MINNSLLMESVYEELKKSIINNEYKSGERLNIDELAKNYGVSRTPVISALKMLEKDGYVIIKQRSGSFVRKYSIEEITALYDFRLAVEILATKRAIKYTDKEKLQNYADQFQNIYQKILDDNSASVQLMDDFFDIQLEFHCYLINLSPEIIANVVKNLIDLTRRTGKIHMSYIATKIDENIEDIKKEIEIHIQLVKAVMNKDEGMVEKLIEKDLMMTRNYFVKHYDAFDIVE